MELTVTSESPGYARRVTSRRLVAATTGAILATLLAACSTGTTGSADAPTESPAVAHSADPDGAKPAHVPLRAGERRMTVAMPTPYTPSAPNGVGTDDYRCFLLDPELQDDVMVTGTDVLPGNPDVVHHVILFRAPPEQVAQAQQLDDATGGEGWTCFGGTGLDVRPDLDEAPWLGGWAPGGHESVLRSGYGVPLEAGSRIIMQVHYNLLAGTDPDVSATRLRVTDASADLTPISTMLLPAPVELPCRTEQGGGPLCNREAAVADVQERFGQAAGSTANLLHLLCPESLTPGPVQSCTRTIDAPATIIGVAGHMHLLGRSISIEINPDTPDARTILDIPVWDFDNQGARPIEPVQLKRGDQVKVTCEHDQELRDLLPAFEGQPERYVVWGEGTTDEMCLGILQIAAQ
jgi:hypothetical protein